MRKLSIVIGMTFSLATFGQTSHVDCRTFNQEVTLAQKVVSDFELNLMRLTDKIRVFDDRISERMSLLQPVMSKLEQLQRQEQDMLASKNQLIQRERDSQFAIQALGQRVMILEQEINQLQVVIDNPRTGQSARRNALLQQNRKKRELNDVISQRTLALQTSQELRTELNRVDQQLSAIGIGFSRLNDERLSIENMNPSLAFLNQKRNEAQQELTTEELGRTRVSEQLSVANERLLMCKTYRIKYPTALKVAKEIDKVGCNRYRGIEMPPIPRDANREEVEADFAFVQQAEAEVLQVLCR